MNATEIITDINDLLNDEIQRKKKSAWKAILVDGVVSSNLEKEVYRILVREMNEGYILKDKLLQEKRKKTGRSRGYIPSYMKITSDVGAFIFAKFNWYSLRQDKLDLGIKVSVLQELAEAFNFRIDPDEDKLQLLDDDQRSKKIQIKQDREYNKALIALIIGGFITSILYMFRYINLRF